jgi:hypothetical protein
MYDRMLHCSPCGEKNKSRGSALSVILYTSYKFDIYNQCDFFLKKGKYIYRWIDKEDSTSLEGWE